MRLSGDNPLRLGGGFTLVELTAVLLVVSVVAGVVTWSLAVPRQQAAMEDAIGRIIQIDGTARQHALRQGQAVQIVFDLGNRRITSGPRGQDGQPQDRPTQSAVLPEGLAIGQVLLANGRVTGGSAAIWCSDRGHTATYALRLDGPGGPRWLLIAGLTGQVWTSNNEEQVTETMAALAKRPDAD